MRRLTVAVVMTAGLSACGSDGIPVTVETPGLDNLVNTFSEIAENNGVTTGANNNNSGNSSSTNSETVVAPPEQIARPEIVENYQYRCLAFANRSRVWTWTLRPELKIADQYGVETGRWDWIDNLTLLIKPTGNDQVLASLDESTGKLFLENWGQCTSDSEIQIAEQFTRPDASQTSTPQAVTLTIIADQP